MSITLTGTFTRLDGDPATGTVRVTPSRSPIMDPDGKIVISGPQTFPLDADGKLTTEIPASNDPDLGPAFTYAVDVNLTHASWKISKVWIPHGSTTVDLSEIGDYQPVPGVATRVVTIPADGTDGQVLVWDGAGFVWEFPPKGDKGDQGEPGTSDIMVDTSVGTRVFANGIMVHGDTGIRDVSSLLVNGWTAPTSMPLRLRRIGSTVTLEGRLHGTEATSNVFLSLPTGFGFIGGSFTISGVLRGGDLIMRAGGSLETSLRLANLDIMHSWNTAPTWPTTLPGTPV